MSGNLLRGARRCGTMYGICDEVPALPLSVGSGIRSAVGLLLVIAPGKRFCMARGNRLGRPSGIPFLPKIVGEGLQRWART